MYIFFFIECMVWSKLEVLFFVLAFVLKHILVPVFEGTFLLKMFQMSRKKICNKMKMGTNSTKSRQFFRKLFTRSSQISDTLHVYFVCFVYISSVCCMYSPTCKVYTSAWRQLGKWTWQCRLYLRSLTRESPSLMVPEWCGNRGRGNVQIGSRWRHKTIHHRRYTERWGRHSAGNRWRWEILWEFNCGRWGKEKAKSSLSAILFFTVILYIVMYNCTL